VDSSIFLLFFQKIFEAGFWGHFSQVGDGGCFSCHAKIEKDAAVNELLIFWI